MAVMTHSTPPTSPTSSHGSGSVTLGSPHLSQPTPTTTAFSEETASDDEYDAAENPDDPVEGWPRVALLMAKTPDFAAFSRFRDLNVKSLLYYQAQLTGLRLKLHNQEYRDRRGGKIETSDFAERADFLMSDEGSEQFMLITQIRKVLREYNEALLQYSQVSALPEPEGYNMKGFRKWLKHPDGGNYSIGGTGEQDTWGNLYKNPDTPTLWKQFWILLWSFIWAQPPSSDDLDLVVTRPSSKIDGFTRWVAGYLIPFYEELRLYRKQRNENKRKNQAKPDVEKDANNTYCIPFYGELRQYQEKRKEDKAKKRTESNTTPTPRPENWANKVKKEDSIETWSEKGMLRFTSAVSTVIACMLPIVAITVLSQLQGIRNLLLCLAGFAVIFAVGLIFLTNGTSSRVEIFTATSAFAAVLVVFISVPVVTVAPCSPST